MVVRKGVRQARRATWIALVVVALAGLSIGHRAPAAAQAPGATVARVHLPSVLRLVAPADLPPAPTAPATPSTGPTGAPIGVPSASPTFAPTVMPTDGPTALATPPTPGPTATGKPDEAPRGLPLAVADADRERWVFEPFPDAVCGRGTPTGLGLNFTAQSRDVVLYFEGGGACWDVLSCLFLQTAANLDGVTKEKFDAAVAQGLLGRGIFDRADPSNPFRTMNWVYVPYCTGDAHLGDRTATYQGQTIRHVGWRNVEAYLRRVVPTFADAPRVIVTGFSAGGLGSTGNLWQVAEAFKAIDGPAPVLIDDAGPILRPPHLTNVAQTKLHDAWGLGGTIERSCPECVPTAGYHEAYAFLARNVPGFRGSLLSSYEDTTIRSFYGLLNGATFDGPAMRRGLNDLADWTAAWDAAAIPGRFRVFYYGGERHGALTVAPLGATPGLVEFLQAQLAGDAQWGSVRPSALSSARSSAPAAAHSPAHSSAHSSAQ